MEHLTGTELQPNPIERLQGLFSDYEEALDNLNTADGEGAPGDGWEEFPRTILSNRRDQICECVTEMDELSFDERLMCLRQVGMCIDTPSERWILDKLGAVKDCEIVHGPNKLSVLSPPKLSLQYVKCLERVVVGLWCETKDADGSGRLHYSGVVGDWADPQTPGLTILKPTRC